MFFHHTKGIQKLLGSTFSMNRGGIWFHMPLSEASHLLNGRIVAETRDTFLSSALVRFLRRSIKGAVRNKSCFQKRKGDTSSQGRPFIRGAHFPDSCMETWTLASQPELRLGLILYQATTVCHLSWVWPAEDLKGQISSPVAWPWHSNPVCSYLRNNNSIYVPAPHRWLDSHLLPRLPLHLREPGRDGHFQLRMKPTKALVDREHFN